MIVEVIGWAECLGLVALEWLRFNELGGRIGEGRKGDKTDNTAHRWRPRMGYKAIKTSPDSHWAITVKREE